MYHLNRKGIEYHFLIDENVTHFAFTLNRDLTTNFSTTNSTDNSDNDTIKNRVRETQI